MKQARLDQLADGIFAIVMTVLVFNIKIPDYSGFASEQDILRYLIGMYPVFLSYLLSFSLLFSYWRSHHFIASILAKNIDTRFSNLNAIFFFFVGLVPFASHLLGKYNYSRVAVVFFALNIILIGLSLYRMRQHVIKSDTIENMPISVDENKRANIHILFPVFAALFAVLVSFLNNNLAIIFFTLAILFNIWSKSTAYTFRFIDFLRGKS